MTVVERAVQNCRKWKAGQHLACIELIEAKNLVKKAKPNEMKKITIIFHTHIKRNTEISLTKPAQTGGSGGDNTKE